MVCMNEMITARNTQDGTVGRYPRYLVDHPVIGRHLEEVPHGTKPTVPLDELVREKFDLPAREDAPESAPKRKKSDV